MFSSLPVGDDVIAGGVGQRLRNQGEMQLHRPLAGEVGQQVGIFGGNGGCGNFGQAIRVHGHASVRNAVIRSADRAHQHCGGADRGSGDGRGGAVLHGVSIGVEAALLRGELLVEFLIEEDDLALQRCRIERLQTCPGIDRHDLSRQSVGGRGDAAAQRGQDYLLRRARRHSWPLNQCAGLRSANPVRDRCLLQRHFRAQRAHFAGYIFHGLLGLRGTADARTNIVGQMPQFIQRVWIGQRGVSQAPHIGYLRRGPGARPRAENPRHHLLSHGSWRRTWRRSLGGEENRTENENRAESKGEGGKRTGNPPQAAEKESSGGGSRTEMGQMSGKHAR